MIQIIPATKNCHFPWSSASEPDPQKIFVPQRREQPDPWQGHGSAMSCFHLLPIRRTGSNRIEQDALGCLGMPWDALGCLGIENVTGCGTVNFKTPTPEVSFSHRGDPALLRKKKHGTSRWYCGSDTFQGCPAWSCELLWLQPERSARWGHCPKPQQT